MSRFTVLLMIAGAIILTGCGQQAGDTPPPSGAKTAPGTTEAKPSEGVTVDDVKGEVQDVVKAAAAVAGQEREKFAKKLSAWRGRLDDQVTLVEAKGKTLDEKAREEWQAAWDKVQEKQKSLAQKNEAFEAASAEGWAELKEGASGAAKDLKAAIDHALAEIDRLTAPPEKKPEAGEGSDAKAEEAGSDEK
jgi:hypothetical protein